LPTPRAIRSDFGKQRSQGSRIVLVDTLALIVAVVVLPRHLPHGHFGTSLAIPSVAHELAAQMIGVNNFELPGLPSGVDREIIGQLPSGFWVATRKSMARWISGRSAV
jgi:hypothetical protein